MLDFFFPRTIYHTKSKINGRIVVRRHWGENLLSVQKIIQSGGIVRSIWRKAIKRSSKILCDQAVKRVLILGLGGGSVVHLIKQHWPKAKITGVEIDPKIIEVGKKYFDLGKTRGLRIIQVDAFNLLAEPKDGSWNKDCPFPSEFDLVIVDLYLGRKFPKKAEGDQFISNIKRLLSKNGMAIFNRLRTKEAKLTEFEDKLKKHFFSVQSVKTATNLFFLARS